MGKRKMIHSEKALPGEWRRPCCRSAPFFPTAKAKHSFYSAKEKPFPTEKAKYSFQMQNTLLTAKEKQSSFQTAKAEYPFKCKRNTLFLSNCKSKTFLTAKEKNHSFKLQKQNIL